MIFFVFLAGLPTVVLESPGIGGGISTHRIEDQIIRVTNLLNMILYFDFEPERAVY